MGVAALRVTINKFLGYFSPRKKRLFYVWILISPIFPGEKIKHLKLKNNKFLDKLERAWYVDQVENWSQPKFMEWMELTTYLT